MKRLITEEEISHLIKNNLIEDNKGKIRLKNNSRPHST